MEELGSNANVYAVYNIRLFGYFVSNTVFNLRRKVLTEIDKKMINEPELKQDVLGVLSLNAS